jgi:hypothetical protein
LSTSVWVVLSINPCDYVPAFSNEMSHARAYNFSNVEKIKKNRVLIIRIHFDLDSVAVYKTALRSLDWIKKSAWPD